MTLKELTSCLKNYDSNAIIVLADGREINAINIMTLIKKDDNGDVTSETRVTVDAG